MERNNCSVMQVVFVMAELPVGDLRNGDGENTCVAFPLRLRKQCLSYRITPCMHTGTKRLVCNNAHDPVHSISLAICQPTASHHGLESLSKDEHVQSSQSRSS